MDKWMDDGLTTMLWGLRSNLFTRASTLCIWHIPWQTSLANSTPSCKFRWTSKLREQINNEHYESLDCPQYRGCIIQ